MFCLKCGKILPQGTTVCPNCNAQIPQSPNPASGKSTIDFQKYSSSDYRQEPSGTEYRNATYTPLPPPIPRQAQAVQPPPIPTVAARTVEPPSIPGQAQAVQPPPIPGQAQAVQPPPVSTAATKQMDEAAPQPLKPIPAPAPASSPNGTPLYGKSDFGAYQPDTPRENIDDHLVMSIFTLACCCIPGGLVALIYSLKCRSCKDRGDMDGAAKASKMAFWFSCISLLLGLILGGVNVVLQLLVHNIE